MKKVMQMLVDMYDVDGIGSEDFGEKAADSFGQGQSAMVIQWGHYYNTLKTTWSNIDFGVFEIRPLTASHMLTTVTTVSLPLV